MILINNIIFNGCEKYKVVGIKKEYQLIEDDNFFIDYYLDIFVENDDELGTDLFLTNIPLGIKKDCIILEYDFNKLMEKILTSDLLVYKEYIPNDSQAIIDFNEFIKEYKPNRDNFKCVLIGGDLYV